MTDYYLTQTAANRTTKIGHTFASTYQEAKEIMHRTVNAILINCTKRGIMAQTRQNCENEIKVMMRRGQENYTVTFKVAHN